MTPSPSDLRPLAVLLLASTLGATGCLSNVHRISRGELQAIAAQAPEQRGAKVRVVQNLAGQHEPPEASGPHVHGSVMIVAPINGGYAGGPGSPPRGSATAKADDARAWIVLASLVAASLAFSEGARYDGWVRLHPQHPVHLYGPDGSYLRVPLAQLDANTAAWASRAYIRSTEGPFTTLGRAPLDRVGWTYSVLLGAAEIPSAAERRVDQDATGSGFLGHIQLGVFPVQTLGILLDIGLGYRGNAFGHTTFEARNALELQLFPLQAGPLHAGGYGQIGLGLRDEDGLLDSERTDLLAGFGLQAQLELTTRLALTGRVGYVRLFGEDTAEATLGLSIY